MGVMIYIAVVLALIIATWRRPAAALAGLLSVQVLDFWGQLSHPWFAANGKVTNIFVVLLVALAALRALTTRTNEAPGIGTVTILISLLWLYAALSLQWSPVTPQGLSFWFSYWPYMVAVVLFLPLLFRQPNDSSDAILAVVAVALVMCLAAAFLTDWTNRSLISGWNAKKSFGNALAFAQLAGYLALAAVLLNIPRSRLWLALRLIAIAIAIFVTVKSGTRGQLFSAIALGLLFIPFSRPTNSWGRYLSFGFLAIILLVALNLGYEYAAKSDARWSSAHLESDTTMRFKMAFALIDHWLAAAASDPTIYLTGLGNGAAFSQKIVGFYPHVVPLEILGEEGVIGFVLFVVVILITFKNFWAAHRATRGNAHERGVVTTLGAWFAFALILSLKQGSLVNYTPEIFTIAVVLNRQARLLTQRKQIETPIENTHHGVLSCSLR